MGGLHSGRKRTHTCIDDCLTLDCMWLNRQKLLQPSQDPHLFEITWKHWAETNFSKRTERKYQAAAALVMNERPTLIISYGVTSRIGDYGKEEHHSHVERLLLESTPCHYGGQRWWFRAPCCGRRTRVLYINLKANINRMTPQCRNCQDLHYASQCSSYIAKHITYEKHLLSNYGYTWAMHEYHMLKERYFQITPEFEFKMERSQLQRHLELMKLFISCEKLILKSRMQTLKALSVEGRREFFADLAGDPDHAEDLAEYTHLAAIMIARGIIPADSGDQANNPEPPAEEVSEILDLQLARWIIEQAETAEALKELCEAAA